MGSSNLVLPQSKGSTVEVSIIHGGVLLFLVENKKQGKKILFDLGIMKAWKEKQPPAILGQIEFAKAAMDIEKDVAEQLKESKVPLESINAIIWSHHHIDHTGDPSLFPASTALVVGPGFKSNKITFPGYPENPESLVAGDSFAGRELIELDFSTGLNIGGFPAVDYFGDGSFYILRAQGHTHGHISALARTSDDKFVFLGGDVAHHPGEYRPTAHIPLPESIQPSPFAAHIPTSSCPGALFEECHPAKETSKDYRTTPFYELNPAMNESLPDAIECVNKMEVFDASPNVFVVIGHDASLLDVLPFFPKTISNWDSANYKPIGTWRFLKDFRDAIKS